MAPLSTAIRAPVEHAALFSWCGAPEEPGIVLAELDSYPLPQDPEPLHATDDTAMEQSTWSIGLEGRAWSGSEAIQRHDLLPAQLEMIHGKLLWSEEDRVTLLAALLENVGALRAVQLGDPQVWRTAVARLANP
jgi:hypothetical protein